MEIHFRPNLDTVFGAVQYLRFQAKSLVKSKLFETIASLSTSLISYTTCV